MVFHPRYPLILLIAFFLGCGSSQPSSKSKALPQGRAETKAVEAASAAGYDGSQFRKKIDQTLNRNDERNQAIEKNLTAPPSK